MLQNRDHLLKATARTTKVLLTLEDFDDAIHMALKLIGAWAGYDRISILENIFAARFRVWEMRRLGLYQSTYRPIRAFPDKR